MPLPATAPSGEEIDTRQRIMLAARRIFSERGFDAATLREITEAAQANVAAVNYYFRSKDELIMSVLEGAVEPIVALRAAALEACLDRHGGNPPLEALVEALVRPLIELGSGEHRDTLMVLMRVRTETTLQRIVMKHYQPLHERFVNALQKVLPDLPREEIALRYDCGRGTTLQTLVELAPAARLVSGIEPKPMPDQELLTRRLIGFIAAGFRAPPTPFD